MTAAWPQIPLGEVLTASARPERVDPLKEYRLLGVRLDGEGPFLRETKTGSQMSATTLYKVGAGDFIYSRLFAWRGAFGLIPPELDGCYVSGEFPTFRAVSNRLDLEFLRYWFRLGLTLDVVLADCTGSTPLTRNRFKEEFFLRLNIPLPPLPEQRRIVARIEELAGRIGSARSLRIDSMAEAKACLQSVLHKHFVIHSADWLPTPMAEAVSMDDRQVDPTLPGYSVLPHISGENMESGTCRLLPWRTAEEDCVRSGNYLFSAGSILYSKIRPYLRKAVYVNFQGVCSADVYPMRVVSADLDPLFVRWSLVAEPFTEYAVRLSGRTRMPKLNRKQFLGFTLTHPSLSEQRRIVAELDVLQGKVDELKRLQAETQAELDALMPSILDRAFKGEL